MKPLIYLRPGDPPEAVRVVAEDPHAQFLAGGTNLVDHLKLGIATPTTLVDIRHLPLAAVEELPDGGLRVGANIPNSDLAAHRRVRAEWPAVTRALGSVGLDGFRADASRRALMGTSLPRAGEPGRGGKIHDRSQDARERSHRQTAMGRPRGWLHGESQGDQGRVVPTRAETNGQEVSQQSKEGRSEDHHENSEEDHLGVPGHNVGYSFGPLT